MVAQGEGYIVNTASLAGLLPSPFLAPYAATKHAVVGMTLSLRAEFEDPGCAFHRPVPGFHRHPILDKAMPEDLPDVNTSQPIRGMAAAMPGGIYDLDSLVEDIIAGVEKNDPLVVAPASARTAVPALVPDLAGPGPARGEHDHNGGATKQADRFQRLNRSRWRRRLGVFERVEHIVMWTNPNPAVGAGPGEQVVPREPAFMTWLEPMNRMSPSAGPRTARDLLHRLDQAGQIAGTRQLLQPPWIGVDEPELGRPVQVALGDIQRQPNWNPEPTSTTHVPAGVPAASGHPPHRHRKSTVVQIEAVWTRLTGGTGRR